MEIFTSRLDRWIRRSYPSVTQGMIQQALRKGVIRVNGKRSQANDRITDQDKIIVPLVWKEEAPRKDYPYSEKDIDFFQSLILWEDEDILALNKPTGWATQGGTKTTQHIDGLLQAYSLKNYGAHRPIRLVHRLDKDTSGVLVTAKTLPMSAYLANLFQDNKIQKTYWAFTEGRSDSFQGLIDASLVKDVMKDRMKVDFQRGKSARTEYRVLKNLSHTLSWIEFKPLTGRTHQLRVHAAYSGFPILGDRKYGKESSHPLCLHSRKITLRDRKGNLLTFTAPPPPHMEKIFNEFNLDLGNKL